MAAKRSSFSWLNNLNQIRRRSTRAGDGCTTGSYCLILFSLSSNYPDRWALLEIEGAADAISLNYFEGFLSVSRASSFCTVILVLSTSNFPITEYFSTSSHDRSRGVRIAVLDSILRSSNKLLTLDLSRAALIDSPEYRRVSSLSQLDFDRLIPRERLILVDSCLSYEPPDDISEIVDIWVSSASSHWFTRCSSSFSHSFRLKKYPVGG